MFDIKTPKRIYFLAVDSKDEMTTWVRMICSACGLQSTKDEDASYPPPSMTNATLPTQTEEVKPESLAISSPYIHISTCYSGKPPPPKPERTNPAVVDLKAAAAAKPSCDHEEDDSVFEAPEKPRRTRNEVDVMISNLTLQNPKSTDNGLVVLPPGRPPKPSHLSSSSAGKPTSFASNYENSNEMEELCSSEQNNNKNRNDKSGPEVSRSLKPGRQASRDISKTLGAAPSSSSRHQDKRLHSATLGPPVKRNLKPRGKRRYFFKSLFSELLIIFWSVGAESMRHISGLSTSWSNSQNGRGSSDSDSDFESRRNSGSEEQVYNLLQSGPFNSVGRKYLGSGWLYQKTKGTLWSPTSRDLSDSTTGSSLTNSTRKKLQRPKLKKSQTSPWKGHFSLDDFLGLQQSLCNITFSLGIFMSKYQRENLLKCTTVITESKWSILMASFWQQFSHSKRDFWLKPTIPKKIYIFWG